MQFDYFVTRGLAAQNLNGVTLATEAFSQQANHGFIRGGVLGWLGHCDAPFASARVSDCVGSRTRLHFHRQRHAVELNGDESGQGGVARWFGNRLIVAHRSVDCARSARGTKNQGERGLLTRKLLGETARLTAVYILSGLWSYVFVRVNCGKVE